MFEHFYKNISENLHFHLTELLMKKIIRKADNKQQREDKFIKKRKRKEKVITFPMTKEEQKIAAVYQNTHLGSYFISLLFMFLILIVLTPNLQNAISKKEQITLTILFAFIGLMISLFSINDVSKDKSLKQKIMIEGVFDDIGTSIDGRYIDINFMSVKIGETEVIFPPQIYYKLNRGDEIRIYCTKILKIVVNCEVIRKIDIFEDKK